MKRLLMVVSGLAAAVALLAAGAIWLGGPGWPAVFPGVSQSFGAVDYSRMPPVSRYAGADGAAMGYRYYPARGRTGHESAGPAGSVVLVHGSSATGSSMHPLAMALADAGHPVYALDIRGHGASGEKGHIDRIGQLEDDLAAFMDTVKPVGPVTLAGFSSGGGFALRIAAGSLADRFQSYLLLAPFVSHKSPTQRPDSGGWVSVGVPRLVALAALNGVGVTIGNALPVVRFGVDPRNADLLTSFYDYNLLLNFGPPADFEAAIHAVRRPLMVLVGANDNMFYAEHFASVFAPAPGLVRVQPVSGVDHVGLILAPAALADIVSSVKTLQASNLR